MVMLLQAKGDWRNNNYGCNKSMCCKGDWPSQQVYVTNRCCNSKNPKSTDMKFSWMIMLVIRSYNYNTHIHVCVYIYKTLFHKSWYKHNTNTKKNTEIIYTLTKKEKCKYL